MQFSHCTNTGDELMRHFPGVDMIADLGTRAPAVSRFDKLRCMMGMTLGSKKAGLCQHGESEISSSDPKQRCLESMG